MTSTPKPLSYADAGVDIDEGNALIGDISPMAKSTRRPGADGALGGFGGLFDLKAAGFKDPVLVAANDGVGTKVMIAIETGKHDTVGIDLVAMCVNDLVVQGAEPLFFLDYFATGKLNRAEAAAVISGIAEGCKQAGAALIGGETAEMPGLYAKGDYDLAGFSVGAAERGTLLPSEDLQEGDVVLGLASDGFHSNGYSLVRKVVARAGLAYGDASPFSGGTLGDALLTPTRIYVKPLLKAIRGIGGIKALAHITGGGITENVPRVLREDLAAHVDLATITLLACFTWAAEVGGIAEAEMLKTFNCGIGMVVVCDAASADAIAQSLEADGERVSRLGTLQKRDGAAVVYHNHLAL